VDGSGAGLASSDHDLLDQAHGCRVIAVLGGLGAALAWAVTTMCYSRASRTLPSASVIAVAMLVGLAVTAPAAAASVPEELDTETVVLLVVAGAANLGGLLLVVTALRAGKVGIVAPIVSTEGAIAAVLAVVAGESVAPGAGVTLAVIVAGIALASVGNEETEAAPSSRRPTQAALLAISAALAFGVSLYATGRVSDDLSVPWALLPARVIGALFLARPLLATRRLVVTREALPFVAIAGVCEVVGFAFFTLGARDSIAIIAVLASQFGALAALAGFVVFSERLTRPQTVGIAAIAVGVAALTWIQA
jgi:drug/metabolite transporter (DMT)-like permease